MFNKLFGPKVTDHKAGGLILKSPPASAVLMKEADKFVAPRKLDFRDMCVQTSNQEPSPHCAGYSTAGYIEVQNWRTLHYPAQVDGDAIYYEAKKIDGDPNNGTTLEAAVQGAMNLGFVSGVPEYIANERIKVQFAIHEFCACIGAFEITDEWNNVGKDGIIPNFGDSSKPLAGHGILICGYDDKGIYVQNSWGSAWGLYGFGFLGWEQFDRQFDSGVIIRK